MDSTDKASYIIAVTRGLRFVLPSYALFLYHAGVPVEQARAYAETFNAKAISRNIRLD